MAQQPLIRHSVSTIMAIQKLYHDGVTETKEESSQIAWEHILSTHFPRVAPIVNHTTFMVIREAHRGPAPAPARHRVDGVVQQLRLTGRKRDIVWVECKAASHDTPAGWKTLMAEAALRLRSAHPARFVYFVAAIGAKAMLFHWDPNNAQGRQALWIQGARAADRWDLAIEFVSGGQRRWVNPVNRVMPDQALELCLGPAVRWAPLNWADIQIANDFLEGARRTFLTGLNPLHWN